MNKILKFVIPVIVCFMVGAIASYLQTGSLETWYPYLNKSPLTPPDATFGIVWSILYLLMGLSLGFILNTDNSRRHSLTVLFGLQLALNFAWSIAFFYAQNPLGGMIIIIALEVLLICYAIKSYPVSKISSVLFWPYIIWVGFAAYLNYYILIHNG